MAAKPLPNYLRMYRKQRHLTQEELAFLVGSRDGSRIARYERFRRQPTLETALALEAALGVPVRELFAGEYAKVEATVRRRARVLTFRQDRGNRKNFSNRHLHELLQRPPIGSDEQKH